MSLLEVETLTSENEKTPKERSLRICFPKLYRQIVTKLEDFHIHPYDLQINIKDKKGSYQLILHYGKGYSHTVSQHFTAVQLNEMDPGIIDFVLQNVDAIKEVMVADYFKMMKV